MPPPTLESLPGGILEKITLALVMLSFLGPPTEIIVMRLLCKRISSKISSPHICAQIFARKFDARAAIRRLGEDCGYVEELAGELVTRSKSLKRLRNNVYASLNDPEILRVDLWTAYLMFLENEGNNSRQLIDYARVGHFALHYICPGGRLHDGKDSNKGWPVDSENNTLALWLFWFTDKERVQNETLTERETILEALLQLFVGSFKYPSTHAPVTTFMIPPATPPLSDNRPPVTSLASLEVFPDCIIPDHFGYEVTLAKPLMIPPALLSCLVRFEAEMLRLLPSPEYDAQFRTKTAFVDWSEEGMRSGETGSGRHEHDWMRLRTCYDPWSQPAKRDRVFTPGMLHGKWVGGSFITPHHEFEDMVLREQTGQPAAEHNSPQVYLLPMQFYLREHHQRDDNDMVEFDDMSCDDTGKGVLNAWLPKGTTMHQINNKLQVYVPDMINPSTYQTFAFASNILDEDSSLMHEGLYGGGVWDIILTAETDATFGEAWGSEPYYGRVRDWDGLIMLVRNAAESGLRWIFYGYVHGKRNLVGRWRETGRPVDEAGWSGVWCMTKEDH